MGFSLQNEVFHSFDTYLSHQCWICSLQLQCLHDDDNASAGDVNIEVEWSELASSSSSNVGLVWQRKEVAFVVFAFSLSRESISSWSVFLNMSFSLSRAAAGCGGSGVLERDPSFSWSGRLYSVDWKLWLKSAPSVPWSFDGHWPRRDAPPIIVSITRPRALRTRAKKNWVSNDYANPPPIGGRRKRHPSAAKRSLI